jgi:hypothetical protein
MQFKLAPQLRAQNPSEKACNNPGLTQSHQRIMVQSPTMKTDLPLILAASTFILAGCNTTPRTWEYKEVSSVTEKNTLCQQGWKHVALVHVEGGADAFLMKRKVDIQTSGPTVAAPPPFRPMLVTTFGTYPSLDDYWRIGVSEDSIDLTRLSAGGMGFTPESHGWRAQEGWFVFTESESRAWAYDGGSRLYLADFTWPGKNNNSSASLYVGSFFELSKGNNSNRAAYFRSNFPCAVPIEVISHMPERKQKVIQTDG